MQEGGERFDGSDAKFSGTFGEDTDFATLPMRAC
jgi:hypothetical protein